MKLLNYAKLVLLSVLAFTMLSCQDDNEIYDQLIRGTWVGDLGFYDKYGDLESGLYFEPGGFGVDEQCYMDDPDGYIEYKIDFHWNLGNGTLTLDYGPKYPIFELRDVYILNDELHGVLYRDGHREGPVTFFRY